MTYILTIAKGADYNAISLYGSQEVMMRYLISYLNSGFQIVSVEVTHAISLA